MRGSVHGAFLVVFAGLPGSGKSMLARGAADAIGATYLRIDSIESAIVSTLMPYRDNPVGYVVAEFRLCARGQADTAGSRPCPCQEPAGGRSSR